jgi:hypothetical protein
MHELREKVNAARRERYAKNVDHRAKRRQQAEAWKEENRESYLAQQREYARNRLNTLPGLLAAKDAQKKYYDANAKEQNARVRRWRAKNPGYHARWHAANKKKNPVLYMWRNSRNRAKALGIEFSITQSDIIVPEFCPVLGLKLSFNHGKQGFYANESPSIDRFNNAKGYIKENIRIISWRANMLKRDGTLDEFRKIVAYLER